MSNQTIRKPAATPPAQESARPQSSRRSNKTNRYRRQSARLGGMARRDGKPLIFGWGRHLSSLQKERIRRRAIVTFGGVVLAAVLGVLAFGVLQQNVLIPNQTFVAVNSTSITQDNYRKYLAYRAQVQWNHLQTEIAEQASLAPKIQAGDPIASQRNQTLTALIQSDESSYKQSAITQSTVDRLVEDQLLQQSVPQLIAAHHAPSSTFVLKDADVQAQLTTFKGAFPKGETYQQFLDANGMSNDDVLAGIRIDMRRDLMQTYLTSLLVSPTIQVHLRKIELGTADAARQVLADLQKDSSDAYWTTLAKQKSLDPQTKDSGGDTGWTFQGHTDAAIENWAFDPGLKVGALSPVIKDAAGTFDVVQLLGIDPSRPVDPTLLSAAQSTALDHWLSGRRTDPRNHIATPGTDPSADMSNDARNMPKLPDLNAQLPTENVRNPSSGVPGGTQP